MLPTTTEPGFRLSVSDHAPPMVVIQYQSGGLERLLVDPQQRQGVLEHIGGSGQGGTRSVVFVSAQGEYVVVGPLPDNIPRPRDLDCTHLSEAAIDASGAVAISIAAGLCGMEHTQVAFEFGADGVEIADERFIDDPRSRAEQGTVAIDHPASRGYAPGAAVDVVVTSVPEEDIAPRADGREWPRLREFVCFDATIHAGAAAGAGGQVVPDVVVSERGERVPIAEPSSDYAPARVITQDAGSAVVWSFGPIDLDDHQPDEITATASEGEIESWDVSARHC